MFRFLNMRYPRDYNTVPRYLFWLFHLLWLFPWSAFLPGLLKLSYKPVDRGGRMRLLALCWAGFVLVFFTFSTTQEYYSMPIYPALALLLGCVMASPASMERQSEARASCRCRRTGGARDRRYLCGTCMDCPHREIFRTLSHRTPMRTHFRSDTWAT